MKSLIRKVLLEYVKELDELDKTIHLDDRSSERLLDSQYHIAELRYKNKNGYTESIDIGTYVLSENFLNAMKNRLRWLYTSFKFPDEDQYGIVLGRIKVNLEKIDLYYPEDKDSIKDIIEKQNGVIYLKTDYIDDDKNSTGNIVFLLIANNTMITLLFERSLEFGNVKQRRNLKSVVEFDSLIK